MARMVFEVRQIRMEVSGDKWISSKHGWRLLFIGILSAESISPFAFFYPDDSNDDSSGPGDVKRGRIDADGDLEVKRRKREFIRIEHFQSTDLRLVGLQVWRGALILADFLFHHRHEFANKRILEMGSGVGLSSIAAAIFAKKRIVCTDIDIGGILNLIRDNIKRNAGLMSNEDKIDVMELDFNSTEWSKELCEAVRETDVIIAADGWWFIWSTQSEDAVVIMQFLFSIFSDLRWRFDGCLRSNHRYVAGSKYIEREWQ